MYSILPLVDMTQTHLGLYIAFAMLMAIEGVVMYFYLQGYMSGKETSWTSAAITGLLVLIGFGSFSGVSPKNEKIIAKFEGFIPTQIIKNGKVTSTSNVVYGVFDVPAGKVTLPVDHTKPVAPYVYLYKN